MTDDIYADLAPFYDTLNGEIDPDEWADSFERRFSEWGKGKITEVLDLGCGTGRITLTLAARGYDMVGVDRSEEMLAEAKCAAEKTPHGEEVLWLEQDMTSFDLFGTVDATVCSLDCINHLTKKQDLASCFALVHNFLVPDGLFLFDVNTPYKFENIYSDRAYLLEDDGVLCAWQNDYHRRSKLCRFYISLFSEEKDGRYTRSDSCQTERCYSMKELKTALSAAGFALLSVEGDLAGNAPEADTPRWHFTARAIK